MTLLSRVLCTQYILVPSGCCGFRLMASVTKGSNLQEQGHTSFSPHNLMIRTSYCYEKSLSTEPKLSRSVCAQMPEEFLRKNGFVSVSVSFTTEKSDTNTAILGLCPSLCTAIQQIWTHFLLETNAKSLCTTSNTRRISYPIEIIPFAPFHKKNFLSNRMNSFWHEGRTSLRAPFSKFPF